MMLEGELSAAPVSMNAVRIASSRRPTNVLSAAQVSSRRFSSGSRRTGGGASGSLGGFMRSIGLVLISPSSTSQRKNEPSAR